MLYTPATRQALKLCCKLHENQFDKSGIPYLAHPLHLAEQMSTEAEICAALLHDVLEDSSTTPSELLAQCIPAEAINAILLLTHDEGVPYFDYIQAIQDGDFSAKETLPTHNGNALEVSAAIARKVKIADLRHNSDLGRLDMVLSRDLKRLDKYQKARIILGDLIYKVKTPLSSFSITVNKKPFPFHCAEIPTSIDGTSFLYTSEPSIHHQGSEYHKAEHESTLEKRYAITVDTLMLQEDDIVSARYNFGSVIRDYDSDEHRTYTTFVKQGIVITLSSYTESKYRYSNDYPYQLMNAAGTYKIVNDPIAYRSLPQTRFIMFELSWMPESAY